VHSAVVGVQDVLWDRGTLGASKKERVQMQSMHLREVSWVLEESR
jgi:hypothetical protein